MSYKRGLLSSIFNNINETIPLYKICDYISSSKTISQLEILSDGKYAVYDAGGITTFINNYDMETEYVAIIKDGSGVGRLQFCQAKSSFIGTLGGLTPKNCSAYYLYSVLQNVDFKNFVTGMAIPHIYYKDYKNIHIPFPDQKSIKKIESIFMNIDKLIKAYESTLYSLKNVKCALLQQMFI